MVRERARMDRGLPRWAVAAVAVMLFVAACGGGDDGGTPTTAGDDGGGQATPTQPATTTSGGSDSTAGLEAQTFDVGEAVYHSGFQITVDSGEIVVDEDDLRNRVDYYLILDLALENLAPDEGFIDAQLAVVTDSNSYPGDYNQLPFVAGGLTSRGELTFVIDEEFDLSTAVFLIGGPDVNQARVPLSGSGEVIRLEPMTLDIAGSMSMELLDLSFTAAELRYDLLPRHGQADAGTRALTLTFDVVSRRQGNWNLFDNNFALIGPDGAAVAPVGYELGSLAGSADGVATTDRYLRFIVDEMPAGDYILRLTPGEWFVGEDGVTEATFEFTIDG